MGKCFAMRAAVVRDCYEFFCGMYSASEVAIVGVLGALRYE
jgi:hypothetical protein